jgi:hypothetical protein
MLRREAGCKHQPPCTSTTKNPRSTGAAHAAPTIPRPSTAASCGISPVEPAAAWSSTRRRLSRGRAAALDLELRQGVPEEVTVDPENGAAEHLDESSVEVQGESFRAQLVGEAQLGASGSSRAGCDDSRVMGGGSAYHSSNSSCTTPHFLPCTRVKVPLGDVGMSEMMDGDASMAAMMRLRASTTHVSRGKVSLVVSKVGCAYTRL